MKKFIAFLLAALMVMSFAACSSNNSDNPKTSESDQTSNQTKVYTPAEIETAIAKALGDSDLCTVDVPKEEIVSSAIGYLDLTKVKAYIAKQTNLPSVMLDSIVIAECEPGYADEAVKLFNENYAQVISYIRQYPFGVAKAENARIYKVGNTVMFIMAGADADENTSAEDEAKLAVSEYEKIDNAIKSLFGTLPKNLAVVAEPADSEDKPNFFDYSNDTNDSGFDPFGPEGDSELPPIGG